MTNSWKKYFCCDRATKMIRKKLVSWEEAEHEASTLQVVTAHVLSTLQCLVRPSPQRRGRLLEVGRNNPAEFCTASM